MAAAYVFIEVSASDLDKLVTELRRIPAVKQAHLLLGPTDAIAYVECDDDTALRATIHAIRDVSGVIHTDTRYVYA
ncbi:MAG TPA: Lrp/AsnC ligand binding domain-containing protein [Herpetosiphonaceae bacterium]|nr:Lrp/AsnC ligand binding domain-containing protein [Herpetosiphonaceae bacterium]